MTRCGPLALESYLNGIGDGGQEECITLCCLSRFNGVAFLKAWRRILTDRLSLLIVEWKSMDLRFVRRSACH